MYQPLKSLLLNTRGKLYPPCWSFAPSLIKRFCRRPLANIVPCQRRPSLVKHTLACQNGRQEVEYVIASFQNSHILKSLNFAFIQIEACGWNQVEAVIISGTNHDRGSSLTETKLHLIFLTHFFLSRSHSRRQSNEKCLAYS